MIDANLDLGGELLSILPKEELTSLDDDLVNSYYQERIREKYESAVH